MGLRDSALGLRTYVPAGAKNPSFSLPALLTFLRHASPSYRVCQYVSLTRNSIPFPEVVCSLPPSSVLDQTEATPSFKRLGLSSPLLGWKGSSVLLNTEKDNRGNSEQDRTRIFGWSLLSQLPSQVQVDSQTRPTPS